MKIAFALYDGFSTLDFAALYEPLARLGCAWQTCATATDVYDANGLHFYPTCVTASLAGYDVIAVPGGPGALQRLERADLLAWLATASGAGRLVAVGDGVLLLAAAGLARGKRVAARPERSAKLTSFGALPVTEPFHCDDPLATAAGPAAALELSTNLCQAFLNQADLLAGAPAEGVDVEPGPIELRPAQSRTVPVTGGANGEAEAPAPRRDVQPRASEPPTPEGPEKGFRRATLVRQTGETRVEVRVDMDGSGSHQIDTGLPFLDHMLAQVAVHGLFDLYIQAAGDLHIDPHHTLEDVALTLGSAFQEALGDRAGIVRMASADCPMDESLAWVAVDFSGRPYSVIQADWRAPVVGGLPASLFAHFFESFATAARCNLHAAVRYGRDDHHQAEALFKAFGRALCAATRIDPRRAGRVPSSKGVLF